MKSTKTITAEVPFREYLIQSITARFRCFGGDRKSDGNPIAAALEGKAPVFAVGVDVGEVVDFVLKEVADNNEEEQEE